LGLIGQEVILSVVLHLGTCFALIIFFFKDILETLRNPKLVGLVIIVTFITGTIGLMGKDLFEAMFKNITLVAFALIVTGMMLIFTRKFMDAKRDYISLKDAVMLGFAQAAAIIPGISRSGITISTLLFRRIDRQTSFKFSFIASIPAIFSATLLEAKKITIALRTDMINFIVGFIFSLLSGLFSLWVLRLCLRKAKLHYFGYYCIIVAMITLLFIR
jgi:undecaprenyl-diphosphatase